MPSVQPVLSDAEERRGIWHRLQDRLGFGPDGEDEFVDGPLESRPSPLRLHSARGGRIAVHVDAHNMEHAVAAANGMKVGQSQVLNLERATPQAYAQILDFMRGVCHALDGRLEPVGQKVFLCVPANVTIVTPDGTSLRGSGE